MNTKVYLFDQNNSGGVFIINDKLCPKVYITAVNAEEANKKAEEIGIYFDGVINDLDCPCCGDRWYPVSERDAVEKYPNVEWDFSWCDYVIIYDVNMKPTKISKESIGMTWEEFREKAKKMGYVEVEKFPYGKPQMAMVNEDVEIAFYKDGTVECEAYNDDCCGRPFTRDRTPNQMYQIARALQLKEEK